MQCNSVSNTVLGIGATAISKIDYLLLCKGRQTLINLRRSTSRERASLRDQGLLMLKAGSEFTR